ncbi:DUF3054 domain-containing protein [Halorhabdus rudnickae]|uniref:DUF3054 domain-containing protein n=1 Tax=Halorhabdus rudnickae TaxID=1775544 RepID=UPI0010837EEC|nr:DUF3054 domain-containing protein [Halorhabdus rudnickae]
MGTVVETLRSRVDPSAETVVLAVGDLLAIAAFVVIGSVGAHGESLADVAGLVETAVPFVVGWILAAFLGSLYTVDARRSALRAISLTIPAWITAALIGQVLRDLLPTPGSFSLVFLAVSIGAGLVLLLPWRGLTAYWLSGRTLH